MTFLGGCLVAACCWLLGRALLPSRDSLARGLWEEQCLAWLLGAAALPLAAMAPTWAGLRFDAPLAWTLLGLSALAGGIRLRRDRRSGQATSPLPLGRGARVFLVFLGVGSVAAALAFPLVQFDALYHFAYKGKILFYTGNPLDPAFTQPLAHYGRIITHPNYPLGIPFLEAFAAHAGGAWDDRWVQIPAAFWAACMPALVALGLRSVSPRAAACGALLMAAVPMLYVRNFFLTGGLGDLDVGAMNPLLLPGTGDLPLACFLTAACALLLRARRSGSLLAGGLAGLCLAGGVLTKNEGLGLFGVFFLALLLGAPFCGRRAWKATALAGLVGILLAAPWLEHRRALPVIDEDYAHLFTLQRMESFLTRPEEALVTTLDAMQTAKKAETRTMRLPLIGENLGVEFVNVFNWGLLWILFWAGLANVRILLDPEFRWLALLVLGGLLLYALIMLVTPWSLGRLFTTGIPERLFLHLAGPAAILIGMRFGPAAPESAD